MPITSFESGSSLGWIIHPHSRLAISTRRSLKGLNYRGLVRPSSLVDFLASGQEARDLIRNFAQWYPHTPSTFIRPVMGLFVPKVTTFKFKELHNAMGVHANTESHVQYNTFFTPYSRERRAIWEEIGQKVLTPSTIPSGRRVDFNYVRLRQNPDFILSYAYEVVVHGDITRNFYITKPRYILMSPRLQEPVQDNWIVLGCDSCIGSKSYPALAEYNPLVESYMSVDEFMSTAEAKYLDLLERRKKKQELLGDHSGRPWALDRVKGIIPQQEVETLKTPEPTETSPGSEKPLMTGPHLKKKISIN